MAKEGDEKGSKPQPVEGAGEANKKGKKKGSARGIETMFRNVYRMHVELSNMADNKAGLLTTLNTLLLGLSGPFLGLYSDEILLMIPLCVIIFSSALSLILSVMVARPRITKESVTLEELAETKGNLLFFGNFTRLEPDDFVKGMDRIIENPEKAYPMMTRDIHSLGLVLQRKFGLLRHAYTVVMIGIPTGAILYVILKSYLLSSAN